MELSTLFDLVIRSKSSLLFIIFIFDNEGIIFFKLQVDHNFLMKVISFGLLVIFLNNYLLILGWARLDFIVDKY